MTHFIAYSFCCSGRSQTHTVSKVCLYCQGCKGGCERENLHIYLYDRQWTLLTWEEKRKLLLGGQPAVSTINLPLRPCAKFHWSCLEYNPKLDSQRHIENSKADNELMCLMKSWDSSYKSINYHVSFRNAFPLFLTGFSNTLRSSGFSWKSTSWAWREFRDLWSLSQA